MGEYLLMHAVLYDIWSSCIKIAQDIQNGKINRNVNLRYFFFYYITKFNTPEDLFIICYFKSEELNSKIMSLLVSNYFYIFCF